MGNIRTSFVKRMSKELIETHPGKFTNDFDENKALDNQNLSEETIAFIAMLKLDYWCHDEGEKEKWDFFEV